jgi:hypothetical protein
VEEITPLSEDSFLFASIKIAKGVYYNSYPTISNSDPERQNLQMEYKSKVDLGF